MVIAERSKLLCIMLLCAGIILVVCSLLVKNMFYFIMAIVIGVVLLIIGLYYVIAPKNAIVKEDDNIVFYFTLRKKIIPIKDIKSVDYDELGKFSTRRGFISNAYIMENDIRKLNFTVSIDGNVQDFYMLNIINGKAVAKSISLMIGK